MIARELITLIGFDLDKRSVDMANRTIDNTKVNLRETGKAAGNLGQSMRRAFLGFGLAAGLVAITKSIVGTISEFQKLNAQLVTIEGSAEKADAAFASLQNFAATTPFQLASVVRAFSHLRAVGIDPTMDDMTAIGDVAAGMGKDITNFAGAVVAATSNEMEKLKAFGIVAKQQGDKVTFRFKGVKTTIKKDSKEIFKFLTNLGRTNFAGGMERQAKTIGGAFSNLQDNIAKFFSSIGKAGLGEALIELIKTLTGVAATGDDAAVVIGRSMTAAVKMLTSVVRFAQEHARTLGIALGVMVTLGTLNMVASLTTNVVTLTTAMLANAASSARASIAMAAFGLKIVLVGATIGLIVLLIDDMIGAMEGKESVLATFFNTDTPQEFGEKLKEIRPILLGILAVFGLLLGGIAAPLLLAIAIVGSFISIIQSLADNWNLIRLLIKENANKIALAMLVLLGPLGILPAAILMLWTHWDSVTTMMGDAWDTLVDKIKSGAEIIGGLIDTIGNVFDSDASIVGRLIGGGATSPARDIAARANQISSSTRSTNINAQVPITINPPPGADSDAILTEVAAKIESVLGSVFDGAASNFDGAVD